MNFKLPKKFRNVNVITYAFDDTQFGHEIESDWGFSTMDAMVYCKNREQGWSKEECYQFHLEEEKQLMERLMNM